MIPLDLLDFDVVLLIAMAVAGVSVMLADFRRDREAHAMLVEVAQRLATIEVRHADLEAIQRQVTETVWELSSVRDRMAALETRADYQPFKVTVRRKDGKFGKVKEGGDP